MSHKLNSAFLFGTLLLLMILLPIGKPVLAIPSTPTTFIEGINENIFPTPEFVRLSDADGLSQNTINCFFQDSLGFLWIGTQDGLNRYDGYEFRVFRHDSHDPNSLSSNLIWDISENSQGDLWIATDNGLNWMDRSSGSFIRFLHNPQDPGSISHNAISRVFWDSTGTLWVGTLGGGLDRFNEQTLTFDHFQVNATITTSISSNYIGDIVEDAEGRLWVGTWNGLDLFNRVSGVFTHFRNDIDDPLTLSGDVIRSLLVDPEGYLWIGTTGDGLDRFDLESLSFRHYRASPINQFSLSNNTIWDLFIDSSGALWVATGNGLNYFSRSTDTFRRFQYNNQNPDDLHCLSNPVVYAIFEDRSGVFWVGTGGGGINLFNTSSHRFQYLNYYPGSPLGLSSNLVYTMVETPNHHIWIGTDAGLDEFLPASGRFIHHGNVVDSVLSIYQDRAGWLWLGTVSGLYRFEIESNDYVNYSEILADQNQEEYSSESSTRIIYGTPPRLQNSAQFAESIPLSLPINAMVEDDEGYLWIATSGSGLIRINNARNSWERINLNSLDDGLNVTNITTLLVDDQGNLWIGTQDDGLALRDHATGDFTNYFTVLGDSNSLSSNSITALAQTSDGILWIGTSEGLNRLDPSSSSLSRFTYEDGLPANYIKGILEDHLQNLWISTDRGLSRMLTTTGEFLNFDIHDGLQSNEFHVGACLLAHDGMLYFGGVNGINYFSPDNITLNPYIPPVVITALTQGGENLVDRSLAESVEEITLTWPQNYFEFEFSALSYIQNNENQYAFRMEGLESDWNQVGNRRYGRYTNLPGGTYILHVIASNNDGVWNENGSILRVRVIPPLWENLWFQLSLIGLIGAAIFAGYRINIGAVQKNNKLLSQRVEERTREIERRRRVAEGLRDVLALLNSNCSMEESLICIGYQINNLIPLSMLLLVHEEEHKEPVVLYCDEVRDPSWVSTQQNTKLCCPLELNEWARGLIWQNQPEVIHENIPGIDENGEIIKKYATALLLPVMQSGERLSGLILLFRKERHFSLDELENLNVFAEQAALAIGNARLRTNTEELAVLSERNRLARDLHDAVTQSLFSASLIAEALPNVWVLDQAEGTALVNDLHRLNRSALAEMRNLLLELRPSAITDSSINVLLQQLGEAAIGRMSADLDLDLDHPVRLPSDVHLNFYRMAQEAITNVIKHSNAKKLKIGLSSTQLENFPSSAGHDMIIMLEISDDGCGFDPNKISTDHFGLVNLRDRAQSINADLQIISNPGKGTTVQIIWQGKVEDDGTSSNSGGGGG